MRDFDAERKSVSAATAFSACTRLLVRILAVDARKLTDRECERTEETTRIVLLRFYAFLIGNRIIGSVHKDLCRTDDTDDRENTKGNKQVVARLGIDELGREASIDGFRHFRTATAAVAAFAVAINDFARESNRVNCIDDCGGHGGISTALGTRTVGIEGVGTERTDGSLPAEENHNFLKDCKPLESCSAGRAHAAFAGEFNIRLDRHLEESVVEGDLGQCDVDPQDLGIDHANVAGTIDNLLPLLRHKNPYVFVAVSVTARVQHSVSIDAHRAVTGTQRTDAGAISVVYHDVSPYIRLSRQHGSIVSITFYV